MIILIGESGAGKSTIAKMLEEKCNMQRIISYTTRKPREGEVDGVDYHFISHYKFKEMVEEGVFAEYDMYSQNRCYGTLKTDYENPNSVAVLTPNGLRAVMKNMQGLHIWSVYVTARLDTRMIRYIHRCGPTFNFDDKNEISARVERDYGMFLGAGELCWTTLHTDNYVIFVFEDLIRRLKNKTDIPGIDSYEFIDDALSL